MQVTHLDSGNQSDVDGVVDLHFQLLADSPVVKFGRRFVRDFYYSTLVRDGLVGVALCREGDRVVGFISYTLRPLDFMAVGMKRHFLRLSWLMLLSVVARPAVIRDIYAVLRLMRARGQDSPSDASPNMGEVLSLAAERKFSSKVPDGGKSRMTVRLFEMAMDFFRSREITSVRLLVQPENSASNLFCSVMGCAFAKIEGMDGPVHQYTYTIPEPAPPAEVS